jgi:iron complex outermembrane receptor protein
MRPGHFLRHVLLQGDYTLNQFRYKDFIKGSDDFSGKTVPSVPSNTFSLLADVEGKAGWYSQLSFYAASSIYLNDANTAKADAYQLLGWRIGWKLKLPKKNSINLYAGADNMLDQKYSLGNDINAAGGRYYNAAARRNYYVGIAWKM